MTHSKGDLDTGKKHVLHLHRLEDISIQLLDASGKPEKGTARLTLPDGQTIEKDLDPNGKIEAKQVLPGVCKLEFPVPRGRDPAIETGSVDVLVRDEDGEPVKDAAYTIAFADGSKRQGKTASDGRIQLRDVPAGDYTLTLDDEKGELRHG